MGLKRGPDTESSLKFHGCMNSPHFSLPTQLQLTFSAFSHALPVWVLTYLLFAFLATGCLGQANQTYIRSRSPSRLCAGALP